MLTYPEQGQVLVLAMDVHQVLAQRAQQPERYDSPIHTAGVAAIQVDFPGEDYLLFANVKIVLVQNNVDPSERYRRQARRCPLPWPGGHRNAPCRASARPPSRRPRASNDDRLAGPSLAGEDAEPGSQFNVESFDGGEVGDTEKSKHGYISNHINPGNALVSTQMTVPLGVHANAGSRNGEEQRLASTPVASPDDAGDIPAFDSCSGQSIVSQNPRDVLTHSNFHTKTIVIIRAK